MRELSANEIEDVSGGILTADEGATLELALAASAFAIGSTGVGLVAIGAAAALYSIS
ncbi:MAG: hypothetical protein U5O39_01445 [Gammaproteobacteria bacterium]|nr:hypothetical protein [Gammaproteobacteria bacterium]